jgi:ketosteroid isomerase-like protein
VTDELRRLLDRQAIEDVLVEYARAVDARDWPALAGCFTDDCVVDYAISGHADGPDQVVARCRSAVERLDATQHYVTNVSVIVDGDAAASVCSLAAQHLLGDRTFLFGGVYTDEWRRTPGGWRIGRRSLERRWTSGDPSVVRAATDPDTPSRQRS